MMQASVTPADDYFTYGDLYETLDACDHVVLLLGRLRRQRLLSEQEVAESRQSLSDIRARLELRLRSTG